MTTDHLLVPEHHHEQGDSLTVRLDALVQKHRIPGIVAACWRNKRLEQLAASGTRRAGSGVPLEASDPMLLASCTKAMTATLIALLVQDGVLSFDTTLAEVLIGDWKMDARLKSD